MAQFYSANRRVTTRKTFTVTATDLDSFGQGVARHEGKAIFIPGLLPDEQGKVQITEEKRQYSRAKLVTLQTRSPERVAPRCPHFGSCGGCQQQHVSEALQQRSKSAALQRLMVRETGITPEMQPVITGPSYGYRRRARLGLQFQAKRHLLMMGFRQEQSNNLTDIQCCPVLVPVLEALLQPLRLCLSGLQSVKRLGHVEVVAADNTPVVVLRLLGECNAVDRAALTAFAQQNNVTFYLAQESDSLEKIHGELPYYHADELKLAFSPRDFIQVNDEVNQQMIAQALTWLALTPTDRVLDLFCGMGNFTLPLAKRAAYVTGIEGVPALVETGRLNAQHNHLDNVVFYHENLEEPIEKQVWAAEGFDKVLLDPARAGALGVMKHLVKLAPKRIVYVSCNPTTLARDSAELLNVGYQLDAVRMLDMFPHTSHLESMALFVLNGTDCA